MPQDNVLDEFMDEQKPDTDAFGEAIVPEAETPVAMIDEEDAAEPRKNRRHRRLEEKLQAERESNIEQAAIIRTLTEQQKFRQETQGPAIDDSLLTLYGADEAGRKAAEITAKLLERTKNEAREEALADFRKEQELSNNEVKTQAQALDSMLEEIEDEFDVDLTSNTPAAKKAKTQFFELLEKVSPKDRDGNVKDFADPFTTWELLQTSQTKSNTTQRAKSLGSRSMVQSNGSSAASAAVETNERFLRENGLI